MRKELAKQRGFSLVELIVTGAIILALAAGVLFYYNNNVKPGQITRQRLEAFINLVAGLENVKLLNGNAYPAMATMTNLPISNPTTAQERLIFQATGGENNAYAGWGYQCNGNTLTIRVNLGDVTDTNLRENIRNGIVTNNTDFTCGALQNDGTFTCTKSPVVCR
ncbi:MAG: type II secretion system protein [Nitrososphaerota archaeon]